MNSLKILLASSCSIDSHGSMNNETLSNTEKLSHQNLIKNALISAESLPLSSDLLSDECVEPDFTDCFTIPDIILGDTLDISHCSEGLSTTCYIEGSMDINICLTSSGYLIDFDEDVLLHSIDYGICVIDDIHFDVQHPLDFLCEMDVFYDYYLDEMMEIVVNTLEEITDLSCDQDIRKVRSRYQRDLCVATCIIQEEKTVEFKTSNCGENTACCVLLEEWCVDENGEIQTTVLFHKTRGQCEAIEDWPCELGLGTICYTRDCPNF